MNEQDKCPYYEDSEGLISMSSEEHYCAIENPQDPYHPLIVDYSFCMNGQHKNCHRFLDYTRELEAEGERAVDSLCFTD